MTQLKMFILSIVLFLLTPPFAFGRDSTSVPALNVGVMTTRSTYVLWHGQLYSNSWIWLPNRCLPGYRLDGVPSCAIVVSGWWDDRPVEGLNDPQGQLWVSDWSDPARYQLHSWMSGGTKRSGDRNNNFIYDCVVYCNRQTP